MKISCTPISAEAAFSKGELDQVRCRDAAWQGEQFYLNLYEVIRNHASLAVPLDDVRRQIAIIEECFRQNPQKWG